MSFIANNFSPVGGFHGTNRDDNSAGIALFSYITADTLAEVKTAGYFNELRDDVFQGDVVYLSAHQLDDNSFDNEYAIIFFDSVSRSPLATNVTMDSKDINTN